MPLRKLYSPFNIFGHKEHYVNSGVNFHNNKNYPKIPESQKGISGKLRTYNIT